MALEQPPRDQELLDLVELGRDLAVHGEQVYGVSTRPTETTSPSAPGTRPRHERHLLDTPHARLEATAQESSLARGEEEADVASRLTGRDQDGPQSSPLSAMPWPT